MMICCLGMVYLVNLKNSHIEQINEKNDAKTTKTNNNMESMSVA